MIFKSSTGEITVVFSEEPEDLPIHLSDKFSDISFSWDEWDKIKEYIEKQRK
jgi:hypothetical protein